MASMPRPRGGLVGGLSVDIDEDPAVLQLAVGSLEIFDDVVGLISSEDTSLGEMIDNVGVVAEPNGKDGHRGGKEVEERHTVSYALA